MPEHLDLRALLSGAQAALYVGLSVQAIVNWRNRGLLPVATDPVTKQEIRNAQGRPMYRLADVVAADAATYERRRAA